MRFGSYEENDAPRNGNLCEIVFDLHLFSLSRFYCIHLFSYIEAWSRDEVKWCIGFKRKGKEVDLYRHITGNLGDETLYLLMTSQIRSCLEYLIQLVIFWFYFYTQSWWKNLALMTAFQYDLIMIRKWLTFSGPHRTVSLKKWLMSCRSGNSSCEDLRVFINILL